jgi:hypothetical protein
VFGFTFHTKFNCQKNSEFNTAVSDLTMLWHRGLALCLLLLAATLAEDGVHIRSEYNQLVTSSTLQWVAGESGSHPENAVVGAHEIVQGSAGIGEVALICVYSSKQIKQCTMFVFLGQTLGIILSTQHCSR